MIKEIKVLNDDDHVYYQDSNDKIFKKYYESN